MSRARKPVRLAVRAIIVRDDRLLLVNAFPGGKSDLWCAPGGGVEPGQSLPQNLAREVDEETGLTVSVGAMAMVNEFHDPRTGFHQVDLFFRCQIIRGELTDDHADPMGVVTQRRFFSAAQMQTIRLKPDSLRTVAFDHSAAPAVYDPLERIVL